MQVVRSIHLSLIRNVKILLFNTPILFTNAYLKTKIKKTTKEYSFITTFYNLKKRMSTEQILVLSTIW